MPATLVVREGYLSGVEYEVVRGDLNAEIAYHAKAAHQVGRSTPEGIAHMAMARRLVEVQESVSPMDPQQLASIIVLLENARMNRAGSVESQ